MGTFLILKETRNSCHLRASWPKGPLDLLRYRAPTSCPDIVWTRLRLLRILVVFVHTILAICVLVLFGTALGLLNRIPILGGRGSSYIGWTFLLIFLAGFGESLLVIFARRRVTGILREARNSQYRLCTECGYDLRGERPINCCPECGAVFNPDMVRTIWRALGRVPPESSG